MSVPIIMHVNYCEQGQTLAEICEKAVAWGFDGVEFRRKRAGVSETTEEYLDNLAQAVKKSGLKTVIFGSPGPNLTVADQKVRESEIDAAISFFKMASQMFNLTVCNTFAGSLTNKTPGVPYSEYEKHGSFIATEDQWAWAAEGFKTIGEVAAELNFKLAFETHMCYIHDLPEAAKKLTDLIGKSSVGINLDFGNAVYFKKAPGLSDTINLIKDNLYYVHLKNSVAAVDGKRTPTGLGEGEINHRAYLKQLKSVGYNGPICIEAPRAGDREWFAQTDLAYIKSVMKDLDWL